MMCNRENGFGPLIDRRSAMKGFAALITSTAAATQTIAAETQSRISGMGLVIYDFNLRRKWVRQHNPKSDLFEPLAFLKHCHLLGAGGMQATLGVLNAQSISELREFADQHDLFIDTIIGPPKDRQDLDRFEVEIATARDVQAKAVRTTIIPGRRYERFKTLEEFREFERRGKAMLEQAVPVLEKHRVRFAVENHKDQRIDERVALFEHISSEYVGACVDTGNNIALLDDPYEAIEALAPHAFTVHLKDQSLEEYDDGFLLGDVPLGQGSFDLKRMVRTIKTAKPDVKFALELITRDPLKVPCLTHQFCSTMPGVPASDLAATMRFVRSHPTAGQQVSTRLMDKQVELEMQNVMESLTYAGKELGL